MQRISPFLWFDDNAEEAAKFYTSAFKNAKSNKITRYPKEPAKQIGREPGSVMAAIAAIGAEAPNLERLRERVDELSKAPVLAMRRGPGTS